MENIFQFGLAVPNMLPDNWVKLTKLFNALRDSRTDVNARHVKFVNLRLGHWVARQVARNRRFGGSELFPAAEKVCITSCKLLCLKPTSSTSEKARDFLIG
jgi:hypothetical protein